MKAAILQPGFLPWLGYFDQMLRVDLFIHYDDTFYSKHSWRNRNRIKTREGVEWLTIPVLHHGGNAALISETRIDHKKAWQRNLLGKIHHAYSKAPFYEEIFPPLAAILERRWEMLIDLDLALIEQIATWLAIKTKVVKSSSLGSDGSGKTGRLIDMCRRAGADQLYEGAAGTDYIDPAVFEAAGIQMEFQDYQHPVYPQLHGPFVSHLSILDLLMNCGIEESSRILQSGQT